MLWVQILQNRTIFVCTSISKNNLTSILSCCSINNIVTYSIDHFKAYGEITHKEEILENHNRPIFFNMYNE